MGVCEGLLQVCFDGVQGQTIDGLGAFDHISWWHIAARFCRACSTELFFSSSVGGQCRVHSNRQGEGGEQGDLMPFFFAEG